MHTKCGNYIHQNRRRVEGYKYLPVRERKLADKSKYYFPFSDFYGILRKTFDIAKSRNAQALLDQAEG